MSRPLGAPPVKSLAWGLIDGDWRLIGEAATRSAALSAARDNGADRFLWLPEGEYPKECAKVLLAARRG